VCFQIWTLSICEIFLKNSAAVSIEDVFRNSESFIPANLKNHLPFWEKEILKDHSHKETIMAPGSPNRGVLKLIDYWVFPKHSVGLILPSPSTF